MVTPSTVHSDSKMKADISNRQFVSVFTTERNIPLPTISNRITETVESIFMCHIMVLPNSLET